MATASSSEGFIVWKFKTSGILALCAEVLELAKEPPPYVEDVDWNNGAIRETDSTYEVVFQYKGPQHPDNLRKRADELQAEGPDEFPRGYYEYLAKHEAGLVE